MTAGCEYCRCCGGIGCCMLHYWGCTRYAGFARREGELGMEYRLGVRLTSARNSEISRNCRFIIVSFPRTWGCVTRLLMRRGHAMRFTLNALVASCCPAAASIPAYTEMACDLPCLWLSCPSRLRFAACSVVHPGLARM